MTASTPSFDPKFEWAEAEDRPVAVCIVLVKGKTPEEILDILASDRVGPIQTMDEAEEAAAEKSEDDPENYYQTISAADLRDGWTIGVEDNNYRATVDNRTALLSARGTAVTIFWNVNLTSEFIYAKDGEIIRSFNPFDAPGEEEVTALAEEAGLPFGFEDDSAPIMGMMMLAERLTGIALTAEDVNMTTDRIAAVVKFE